MAHEYLTIILLLMLCFSFYGFELLEMKILWLLIVFGRWQMLFRASQVVTIQFLQQLLKRDFLVMINIMVKIYLFIYFFFLTIDDINSIVMCMFI